MRNCFKVQSTIVYILFLFSLSSLLFPVTLTQSNADVKDGKMSSTNKIRCPLLMFILQILDEICSSFQHALKIHGS